jgi:hypothetical protein
MNQKILLCILQQDLYINVSDKYGNGAKLWGYSN